MSSRPLVLGIAGSPREGGNSDRLLDAALEAAREAGAQTRLLAARDVGITPCTGCNSCSVTGECVLEDGADVYEAIDAADAIIVSSPVYFAGVPAGLKALFDRMQPYWARTYELGIPRPPRRPGGAILVRGGGDPYGFAGAEATARSVLAVLGIDVLDIVHVEGADAPADVEHKPDAFVRARQLGAAVASAGSERTSGDS